MTKLLVLKKEKEKLVKEIGCDLFLGELKEKYPFQNDKIPANLSENEKKLYVVDFLLFHKFITVSKNVIEDSLKNGVVYNFSKR